MKMKTKKNMLIMNKLLLKRETIKSNKRNQNINKKREKFQGKDQDHLSKSIITKVIMEISLKIDQKMLEIIIYLTN